MNIVNYNIYPVLLQTNITNNNSFNFLIDTGSPYTWVSGLKSKYHDHYNVKNEQLKTNEKKNVTYSGGTQISFSIYNSSFYINDKSVKNFPLGVTFYESILLDVRSFDGIIGLGGIHGNNSEINYLMKYILTYNMVKQKIIKNNIFSIYINTTNGDYNNLNLYGGELIFGSIDNSKYIDNIKWYEIYNNNNIYYFWNLKLNIIEINNSLIYINDKIQLDSGNAYLAFKENIFNDINKQIESIFNESTGMYMINNKKKLKNIIFHLNNDKYILTPDDYTYNYNNNIYSRIIINNYENYLGLPFLQKYYSIYNFEDKKIGLAKNK